MPKGKNDNTLDSYVKKIVSEEIKKTNTTITEEDAKKIIDTIMPQLKTMVDEALKTYFSDLHAYIANAIKEHFNQIGQFLSEKFKPSEED